jgi:hypothetical protein
MLCFFLTIITSVRATLSLGPTRVDRHAWRTPNHLKTIPNKIGRIKCVRKTFRPMIMLHHCFGSTRVCKKIIDAKASSRCLSRQYVITGLRFPTPVLSMRHSNKKDRILFPFHDLLITLLVHVQFFSVQCKMIWV